MVLARVTLSQALLVMAGRRMQRIDLVSVAISAVIKNVANLSLVASVSIVILSQFHREGGNMTKAQLLAAAIKEILLCNNDCATVLQGVEAALSLCNEVIDND